MTAEDATLRTAVVATLVVAAAVAGPVLVGTVLAADGTVGFEQSAITEHRGDVVEGAVVLSGTDVAYLQVGTADSGYNATLKLVDGGDGRVALTFNTYYAMGNRVSAGWGLANESRADGDDLVLVRSREPTNGSGALPLGDHEVRVGTALTDGGVLAAAQDTVTVTLEEPSVDGLGVLTAPYAPLEFATREAFLAAFPDRSAFMQFATPSGRVAAGDYVVVEVNASGIYGQVRDRHDLLGVDARGNATGLFLDVREVNPPATRAPHRVDLADRDHLLFVDHEHESIYLLVDSRTAGLRTDTVYEAVFELNGTNALVEDLRRVRETFVVEPREAALATPGSADRLEVQPRADVTLAGEASLAPGSELTVVLDGEDGTAATRTATVTADRTFAATFDLSGVPAGTNLTAVVESGGDAISGETTVAVVGPADGSTTNRTNATTTAATAVGTTEAATTRAATTTAGGTAESTATDPARTGSTGETPDGTAARAAVPGDELLVPPGPKSTAVVALVLVAGAGTGALLARRKQ